MNLTCAPNRLINEKSPYLLQHAYNPVDWYPWGNEAFAKAKTEDKPIFLSIGYSTCHWCHVFEKESFLDEEIASYLNSNYISIKVDREERPDIDHIYMSVCQMLTGSGGWPLTIFMDSDKKPFFAGTYFPKEDVYGHAGFKTLLKKINDAWKNNRNSLLNKAEEIYSYLNQPQYSAKTDFDKSLTNKAFSQFKKMFDSEYGGFNDSPKFPAAHNLMFLLRYYDYTKETLALEMVTKTLNAMYRGGIYDHIGFGFSRYSTDRKWLVPHFEKMLYDNALLSMAYIEAFQVTQEKKFRQVAEEIFAYVLREMKSAEGGFFSAEDADSEGEEGKYYIWSPEEIINILGEDNGKKFCQQYDITSKGNFENKNIPNLIKKIYPLDDDDFIKTCKAKLLSYREKRIHPFKDDKILTSWNGLMIAALAAGGRVLSCDEYTIKAKEAASFILNNLIRKDGRLLTSFRDNQAKSLAFVDDYSFFIWGLIEIYETTYEPVYLEKAVELNKDLIKYFWDNKNGGLFLNGSDNEQLISRPKEIYDGAAPSGNSVASINFLRLARLTNDTNLEEKSHELLKSFYHEIEAYPSAHAFSLITLLFSQAASSEVVIVGDNDKEETKKFISFLQKSYTPFNVSKLYSKDNKNLKSIDPFIENYIEVNGKTTIYFCRNKVCEAPVTDYEEFLMKFSDKRK